MFMISNFLFALAKLVEILLGAYIWIVIGRAILSWVNPDPYNPIVRFLHDVTEPLLSRIRRMNPKAHGSRPRITLWRSENENYTPGHY
jgi:YggT family protein